MTPACSKRARTIESSISTPVAASTGGTACRPLFTATIGFFRATRRAMRENFRGLPKLSR